MKTNITKIINFIGLINLIRSIRVYFNYTKKVFCGHLSIKQSINSIKHYQTLNNPKNILKHSPKILSLVLTQNCNLHCKMCLTHSDSIGNKFTRPKDMSFDFFKHILNTYSNAELISFIGNGEPLLHPHLFKMISHAKKQKFQTLLVTNGTLLEKNSMELIHSGIDSIYISLNGHDSADYVRLTGETVETFLKIKNNIQAFSKIATKTAPNMFIGCSFICDKTNLPYLQNMLDLTSELGANLAVLNNYLDADVPGYTAKERTLFRTKEYENVINSLQIPTLKNQNKMTVVLPIPLNDQIEDYFCESFFTMLRIDGDGQIGGCGRKLLELKNNGHFKDDNHFNNEYFIKHRKGFIEGSGNHIPKECKTCFNSHLLSNPKKDHK